MKFVLGLLFLLSSNVYADNNIISITAGISPTDIQTSTVSNGLSTTTTSTSSGHGKHSSSSTSTTSNLIPSSVSSSTTQLDKVFGLQYQHKMGDSPLWLGVLLQTNTTYSISCGIGF